MSAQLCTVDGSNNGNFLAATFVGSNFAGGSFAVGSTAVDGNFVGNFVGSLPPFTHRMIMMI